MVAVNRDIESRVGQSVEGLRVPCDFEIHLMDIRDALKAQGNLRGLRRQEAANRWKGI
jgi:hypothetical protein